MLLTIFIVWMVVNVGLVLLVIARPPRHLTRPHPGKVSVEESADRRHQAA